MMNESNFKSHLLQKIKEYNNISLFVHVNPDPDAIGSATALINFININFPEKKVSLIGLEKIDLNKVNEYLVESLINHYEPDNPDEFIKNSLGIVVDTPTQERVLTRLNQNCAETIRIDHHPKMETFCTEEWVDDTRSAACEMISEIFKDWENVIIDKRIINPLYVGILTDSNRFMYSNTSQKTFNVAAWMCNYDFDFEKINDLLFNKSIAEKKTENKLFSKAKIKGRIAYMIFKSKKIKSSKIYLLGGFKEIDIWTSIYYDYNEHLWFGSIRSKNIPINQIAEKYNGGGHKFASGFRIKSKSEFKSLLKDLENLLNNYENNNIKQ